MIAITLSGLAVMPNVDDEEAAAGGARDRVFGMAQNATADESGQVRRTITMVSSIPAFFPHKVCKADEYSLLCCNNILLLRLSPFFLWNHSMIFFATTKKMTTVP